MNFTEFEKKNLVKEKGFSWEVEKDAMEWEHAVVPAFSYDPLYLLA
jgi:hypothetical protein